MTAAAVRPDLFTHLFATERAHPDRRDLAATVLSVALHGGAAAALVWASTAIQRTEPPVEAAPIPIVIASPDLRADAPAQTRGGGGSAGAAVNTPVFDQPAIDPTAPISAPVDDPWVPPGDAASSGKLPSTTAGGGSTDEMRGGFVVSKEVPQLLNVPEVQRSLERNYPAILRDAGVGGRVVLWLLIDENGRVIDADVRESSGQAAFDSAAARVAGIMRFSPGKNRESNVKVWVSLPVLFKTK